MNYTYNPWYKYMVVKKDNSTAVVISEAPIKKIAAKVTWDISQLFERGIPGRIEFYKVNSLEEVPEPPEQKEEKVFEAFSKDAYKAAAYLGALAAVIGSGVYLGFYAPQLVSDPLFDGLIKAGVWVASSPVVSVAGGAVGAGAMALVDMIKKWYTSLYNRYARWNNARTAKKYLRNLERLLKEKNLKPENMSYETLEELGPL